MNFRAMDFIQQLVVSTISILLVGLCIYGVAIWRSKRRAREANLEAPLFQTSRPAVDVHHAGESWQRDGNKE
jgi:hypothetical protein